jgi:hypothetical protein
LYRGGRTDETCAGYSPDFIRRHTQDGQIPDLLSQCRSGHPEGEFEAVVRDSYAVIEEAKAAGVYVLGGGIDESVPSVLVAADG